MLSCQDCEKYLYAFLDNGLDVKESLDVEEHVRSCTSCANQAEAEQALRGFIRQQATTPPLPEEAKRRMIRQAIQASRFQPRQQRRGFGVHVRDFVIGVAAAAAVLLLIFRPFSFSSSGDDMVQQFAREASMTYGTYRTQHVPPEVTSTDDKAITRWFNSRMGYKLKIPCITDASTKLLGGRICRLFDRKSAAMIYQRNGVEILLFAFKDGQIPMPEKYRVQTKDHVFYVQSVAGRPVAMWQQDGMTYSMVGDLDRESLVQVATTINYR